LDASGEHEIRSVQKKANDLGLVVTLTAAAEEKFLRSGPDERTSRI
jgi:hypothetical protein